MARQIVRGEEKAFVFRFNSPNGDPLDLSLYEEIRFCFVKEDLTDLFKKRISTTGDIANLSVTITNIDTTDLQVGDLVSGAGIPSGATIATIGVGTVDISVAATATTIGVALIIGDLTFVGNPLLGKINLVLSETDTNLLPVGLNNTEVKLVSSGYTKYSQLPNFLNVVARFC